jgi:hypothetical protein
MSSFAVISAALSLHFDEELELSSRIVDEDS